MLYSPINMFTMNIMAIYNSVFCSVKDKDYSQLNKDQPQLPRAKQASNHIVAFKKHTVNSREFSL